MDGRLITQIIKFVDCTKLYRTISIKHDLHRLQTDTDKHQSSSQRSHMKFNVSAKISVLETEILNIYII